MKRSLAHELALPIGVQLLKLKTNMDERGAFTELFRQSWPTLIQPVQWNAVRSEAGVLRGVHVHIRHDDYLVLMDGRASIGLRDLRQGSTTEGMTVVIQMSGERMTAITIPHGVAHGFFFHEPSLHLYSVSHYWDVEDELACNWMDPDLDIPWPMASALTSERDGNAQPLSALLAQLAPYQPISVSPPQTAD